MGRTQRCELVIDYARRPHRKGFDPDSKETLTVQNLVQVECMQVLNCSGSWHTNGEAISIPRKTDLEIYAWKDADTAVVGDPKVPPSERIYVQMDNIQLVETGRAWFEMIETAKEKYSVRYENILADLRESRLNEPLL